MALGEPGQTEHRLRHWEGKAQCPPPCLHSLTCSVQWVTLTKFLDQVFICVLHPAWVIVMMSCFKSLGFNKRVPVFVVPVHGVSWAQPQPRCTVPLGDSGLGVFSSSHCQQVRSPGWGVPSSGPAAQVEAGDGRGAQGPVWRGRVGRRKQRCAAAQPRSGRANPGLPVPR